MPTKYVIKIKNGLEEYQLKDAEARASYESLATVAKTGNYNDLNDKPTVEISDDAAKANWGGSWRMPTTEEFQALGNAVNAVWTTNYNGSGINGLLCTDKTDSSKTLFFPAAGYCNNGNVIYVGDGGYYWSSSLNTGGPQSAFDLYFDDGGATWDDYYGRCFGFAVRGVLDGSNVNANGHDYVEIGGIKWATMNVGANSITDYGLYFQWGDTQGYTASQVGSGEGQKYFGWADYKYSNNGSSEDMTKYNDTDGLTVLETSEPISSLHKVAVSGSYNDLSDKPTIPAAVAVKGDAESNYRTGNVNITPANIGLGNVGNFKAVSTVASQGLSDTEKVNARENIGAASLTALDSISIIDEVVSAALVDLDKRLKALEPSFTPNAVDMGLPSGRLWADCNVGANSPEEAGLFFQWGDVEGFSKDSGRFCSGTRNGERDWSGDYARTHGSELGDSQNIPTDPYFDAARKYMGSPWRMPTTTEFQELFDSQYTTNAWVTNYKGSGMNGRLVTSKANGNTLFFPAAGYFVEGFGGFGSNGYYWSSSFEDGEYAYYLVIGSGDFGPDYDGNRCCGCSVRAVQ